MTRTLVLLLLITGVASTATFCATDGNSIAQQKSMSSIARAAQSVRSRLPSGVPEEHRRLVTLPAGVSLKREDVIQTTIDRAYRYSLEYMGVPIYAHDVVIVEPKQGPPRVTRRQDVPHLQGVDVNEKLSAERATEIAKPFAMRGRDPALRVKKESVRKVIFYDAVGKPRLAYVVEFYADVPGGGGAADLHVVVDAATGQVIDNWNAQSR